MMPRIRSRDVIRFKFIFAVAFLKSFVVSFVVSGRFRSSQALEAQSEKFR